MKTCVTLYETHLVRYYLPTTKREKLGFMIQSDIDTEDLINLNLVAHILHNHIWNEYQGIYVYIYSNGTHQLFIDNGVKEEKSLYFKDTINNIPAEIVILAKYIFEGKYRKAARIIKQARIHVSLSELLRIPLARYYNGINFPLEELRDICKKGV